MVNRLYAIRIDIAQIGRVGLLAKQDRSLPKRMHITVYVHVLEIADHFFRRQLVEATELVSDRLTVAIDALEERERFLEDRNRTFTKRGVCPAQASCNFNGAR